jgi:hypothetical protein
VTLTIPPLSSGQGQTASVDLLIPTVSVLGDVKETDLSLWSGGTDAEIATPGTTASRQLQRSRQRPIAATSYAAFPSP